MPTGLISTSGRTRNQSSFSNSASNSFSLERGVPTKYCPPRRRIASKLASLTTPRSKIHPRRALPYLRSTVRRITSIVLTSARLPLKTS